MTSDFSTITPGIERQWNNALKILKENYLQYRMTNETTNQLSD